MATGQTVQQYFDSLVLRVPGLLHVLVTDKDGVVLVKAKNVSAQDEVGAEDALIPAFVLASEQTTKMDVGRNRSVATIGQSRAFVHINAPPLVVTCIGAPTLNLGMITAFTDEIVAVVTGLATRA